MKKYLMFLIMFAFMFVAIGKVSADGIQIVSTEDTEYTGAADSKSNLAFNFTQAYNQDSLIVVSFTPSAGVDHFTVTFKSSDTFEVVQDVTKHATLNKYTAILKLKTNITASTSKDFADILIYHKANASEDCEVSVTASIQNANKTCDDSIPASNIYYNDDGEVINAEEYNYYCNKHVCEMITVNNKSIYYNKKGEEVLDKLAMVDSCTCRKENDKYYNWDNDQDKEVEITKDYYDFICEPHACTTYTYENKTYYYNSKGDIVDTEEEMLAACKCRYDADTDKYYDLENKEVSKEEYEKICLCRIEEGKDGKEYFCKKGETCTAEEYENQCPPDVQTGSSIPYVTIISGAALAGVCCVIAAKRNKFKRI